jgi:hypothetical protein
MSRNGDPRIGAPVTEGWAVRGRVREGARPVESGERGTNGSRIPTTLEEAYGLRDGSATPEERGYYQEHVYRLRGEEYRSRGIRFEESARRRRERRRTEALRAGGEDVRPPGGDAYSGVGSEKQGIRPSLRRTDASSECGETPPYRYSDLQKN